MFAAGCCPNATAAKRTRKLNEFMVFSLLASSLVFAVPSLGFQS
jgi:hypothetical protein